MQAKSKHNMREMGNRELQTTQNNGNQLKGQIQ